MASFSGLREKRSFPAASGLLLLLLTAAPAGAQYTANIQGVVEDPSAAGIASAKVDLVNARHPGRRDHDRGRRRGTTGS